MPFGAGKYDDALSQACSSAGASLGLLLILDGRDGPGFSVRTTAHALPALPAILRDIAAELEIDAAKICIGSNSTQ